MKKRVLFIITSVLCISIAIYIKPQTKIIKSQYKKYTEPANIAFADDSLYKCVVDAYNTINSTSVGYDTNLTDEQLQTIKSVSCDKNNNNEKITNTSGIEKMTSLEHLNLKNNEITEIDLSHNTSLKALLLDNNKLKNINIDNNTELTWLTLSYNRLETINLSHNQKLEHLDVSSNQLKSLNLKGLDNLETSDIQGQFKHYYIYNNDISKITEQELLDVIDINNLQDVYNFNYTYKDKDEITKDLPFYYMITQMEATSDKYYIDDEKEFIFTVTDNPSSYGNIIIENIDIPQIVGLEESVEDGKYIIKFNGEIVKEFTILNITSNYCNFGSNYIAGNLTEISHEIDDFLDMTADKGINLTKEFNNTTKVFTIKDGNTVVHQWNYAHATSNKYFISDENNYIFTMADTSNEDILANITMPIIQNLEVSIENGKYVVRYNDEIIKEYTILNITSNDFDFNSDYLFGEYKEIKKLIDDFLDGAIDKGFNLSQETNIVTNKITIKDGDTVIRTWNYANATSEKYDLTKNSIKVTDENIESFLSNINCTGCTTYVATGNGNETSGEFGDDYMFVITYGGHSKHYGMYYTTKGINLNKNNLELNLDNNKTFELITWTSPINTGEAQIEWTSANPAIATVDANGLVTAVANGTTTITVTATTEDGTFTNSCRVLVGNIEIKNYTKNGNYIIGIPSNTKLSDLNLGIDESYQVVITNHKGETKTTGLVGTGDKVKISLDNKLIIEYEIVIKGDVTGSGTSTVSDVAKLYQYLKGKITMDDCYVKAGNVVDTDNEIKIGDVAKLYQYIKGKINKL